MPCSYYTLPVLRGDGDSESPLRHWHRDTLPSPSPHLVSSPAQAGRPIVLYASPTHGLANRRPQRQTAGTHLVWHAMRACCRPPRGRSFIIHYHLRLRVHVFAFTFAFADGLGSTPRLMDVMRTHTHERSVRCMVARYDTRQPREPHTLQLRVRAPFFPVPIPPSPLPGLAWPRVGQDMRPAAAAVVLVAAAMPTRTYTFCQDVETHRRQAATHLESITLLAPEQGPASGRVKLASSSSSSSSPPPPPSPQGPACGKSPRTSFEFLPHLPSACHGHRHARGPGGAPQCRHSLGGRDGGLRGAPPSRFSQRGPDGEARAIRAAWMSRHVCRRLRLAGSEARRLGLGLESCRRNRAMQHIHIHIRVPISRLASGSVSGAFRALVAIAPRAAAVACL